MAAVSTLEVLIEGDSTRLTTALNQGVASTKAFSTQMTATGKVTRSVFSSILPISAGAAGLAIGAFAKSSIQAADQFNQAMTRIAAITDVPASAIGGLQDHILQLSGQTAQAPVELAKDLFFLESSGLSSAQAIEALNADAKAAAVGLGNLADLGKVTAQALNVYGDSGLTAAKVTDTLVATVKETSIVPEELASSLGRVLPIAKQAGISFAQVAASIGTMANAGLNAQEGATALRGMLQALAAPTQQTQTELQKLGLTAQDVRDSLAQHGLIDTLRMLEDRTGGNIDAMRQLVPNVRALTGVFNLTGQQAQKVDQIFQDVVESSGALAKAWAATSASPSFKFHQALQEISNAGLQLGITVLPALADITQALVPLIPTLAKLGTVLLVFKAFDWIKTAVMALTAAESANTGALAANTVAEEANVAAHAASLPALEGEAAARAMPIPGQMALPGMEAATTGAAATTPALVKNLGAMAEQLAPVYAGFVAVTGAMDEWTAVQQHGIASTQTMSSVLGSMQKFLPGLSMNITHFADSANGLNPSNAKTLQDAFSAIELQLKSGMIDTATAIDQTHQLADAYGITLPDGVDAGLRKIAEMSGAQRDILIQQTNVANSVDRAASGFDRYGFVIEETGKKVKRFLGMSKADVASWKDSVTGSFTSTFGTIGGAVDTFKNESVPKFIKAAGDMASKAVRAAKDMESLAKLKAPDEFKKWLIDQGPAAIDQFVSANHAGRQQVIDDFHKQQAAAERYGAALDQITHPRTAGVHVRVYNMATLDQLQAKIQGLNATLNIGVHTVPQSPWPDEALKMHLIDPIKMAGFKMINGRWTLPLMVGVHAPTDALQRLTASTHEVVKVLNGVPIAHGPRPLRFSFPQTGAPTQAPNLNVAHGASTRPLHIHLGRKKFSEELAYDAQYRGW